VSGRRAGGVSRCGARGQRAERAGGAERGAGAGAGRLRGSYGVQAGRAQAATGGGVWELA
jgi:hypothetical protein